MTMGQRILAARLERGLSQRQLAGEEITRNMLSALEHDGANPSVATLRYLAEKLDKPVGYFLGEEIPSVEGYDLLEKAREAYDNGAFRQCLEILADCPDGPVIGRERKLLELLALVSCAEEAIGEKRTGYARELLDRAEEVWMTCLYGTPELLRRIRLDRAACAGKDLPERVAEIPWDDREWILRAQAALENGQPRRAEEYLMAVQDQNAPRWELLMGRSAMEQKDYARAVPYLQKAEEAIPEEAIPRLEICYRELEDYKMAYFYARKSKL